jgi:hypothetical protein
VENIYQSLNQSFGFTPVRSTSGEEEKIRDDGQNFIFRCEFSTRKGHFRAIIYSSDGRRGDLNQQTQDPVFRIHNDPIIKYKFLKRNENQITIFPKNIEASSLSEPRVQLDELLVEDECKDCLGSQSHKIWNKSLQKSTESAKNGDCERFFFFFFFE